MQTKWQRKQKTAVIIFLFTSNQHAVYKLPTTNPRQASSTVSPSVSMSMLPRASPNSQIPDFNVQTIDLANPNSQRVKIVGRSDGRKGVSAGENAKAFLGSRREQTNRERKKEQRETRKKKERKEQRESWREKERKKGVSCFPN